MFCYSSSRGVIMLKKFGRSVGFAGAYAAVSFRARFSTFITTETYLPCPARFRVFFILSHAACSVSLSSLRSIAEWGMTIMVPP